MAFDDIDALIRELNSAPNWYYDELSAWEHLSQDYIIPPSGNYCEVLWGYTVQFLNWRRKSWYCSQ